LFDDVLDEVFARLSGERFPRKTRRCVPRGNHDGRCGRLSWEGQGKTSSRDWNDISENGKRCQSQNVISMVNNATARHTRAPFSEKPATTNRNSRSNMNQTGVVRHVHDARRFVFETVRG